MRIKKKLNIGSESVDHAKTGDIKVFLQFPENPIWNFRSDFEIARVASIYVGVIFTKSPLMFGTLVIFIYGI